MMPESQVAITIICAFSVVDPGFFLGGIAPQRNDN